MQKNLNTIAKGAAFMFAGYVISKLLAYVYLRITTAMLSPSDIGILSIGFAVEGMIIAFGALGLYQGVLHFIAVYDSTQSPEKVRGTIIGSLKLQLVAGPVFAIALFLASDYIANGFTVPFLGIFVGYRIPQLGLVLKILAFAIPLEVLTSNFVIIMHAFKKVKYRVLLRNIIENIARISIIFTLLLLGFGLFGASLAAALTAAISFSAALYLLQRKVYPVFLKQAKVTFNLSELLDYSWPLFAVGFFGVLMKSVDTLMLGYLSTTYNTGIYSIAMSTANMLTIAENSLGVLFLPIITGLYAIKSRSEMHKTYSAVTRWVFSITFPATLFTLLFSAEILTVLFGKIYAEGAVALGILAIGFFLVSFCGPVRSMIESIAKTRLMLYNTLAATAANMLLNALLIPLFGINGAALATMLSFFLLSAMAWLEVYYLLRVRPYSKAFLKPALASCIAIAAFYLLKQALPPLASLPFAPALALLLGFGSSFILLYTLLFIALGGLQPEDLTVLTAVEAKTGLRIAFIRNFVKKFTSRNMKEKER
ncbi:MAG: flippase, partial [Candidatus Diapherotrites archaeon]|nr:flippase [Candidatus Diapherotrites archaeon]